MVSEIQYSLMSLRITEFFSISSILLLCVSILVFHVEEFFTYYLHTVLSCLYYYYYPNSIVNGP